MPAHVIYPQGRCAAGGLFEPLAERHPARQLGFDGAIFSDDLSMAGARQIDGRELSYTEAAVLALNAGCDLVLLCNQSVDGGAAIDELLDGLRGAARGRWQPDPDSEARRLALLPQTAPLAWDEPDAPRRPTSARWNACPESQSQMDVRSPSSRRSSGCARADLASVLLACVSRTAA